ncbi:MAG TPA: lactonase family protein [Blastocatellia bacterium]|nr:lactonase family protein [Blastocatellia bacterium]
MASHRVTRRDILKAAGLGAMNLCLPSSMRNIGAAPFDREVPFFVGTYTSSGKSKGIYACKLNVNTGALRLVGVTSGVVDPSFLTIDRHGKHLYAVNELSEYNGKPGGAVSGFGIDRGTLELSMLNQQPSLGASPCHIAMDPSGKFAVVANYGGGSIALIAIKEDGGLEPPTFLIHHNGSSVNPKRQEAPHAHCVAFDRGGRFLLAADLGLDKIMTYKLDTAVGKLIAGDPPSTGVRAGSGPRHIAFHPRRDYVYVINELDSTVTAFAYDPDRGALRELQSISTLPKSFSGENTAAEIQVSPSGRFLYGSNRGHDSVAVFGIDNGSGQLSLLDHTPSRGATPRNFAIEPSGKYLLVANQNSDNIVAFAVDPEGGVLMDTNQSLDIPRPVCITFLP